MKMHYLVSSIFGLSFFCGILGITIASNELIESHKIDILGIGAIFLTILTWALVLTTLWSASVYSID